MEIDRDPIADAQRVLVLTGAGISAPSGVPTYRAAGSGWDDPRLERMSHASQYGNFLPQLWEFWGRLRALTAAAEPNPAHTALASLEHRLTAAGGWCTVVTQNVDGLHGRAGSTDVVELHGSIHRTRCLRRACATVTDPDTRLPQGREPLRCASCARPARPDVVLFGENPLRADLRRAEDRIKSAPDLCLVIGTSGNVWPAAGVVYAAKDAGAYCVLVNAEQWPAEYGSVFDKIVLGSAADTLPGLLGA